jgi:alpha-1,3-mannosylglycoprotein beta-1,4-N-acetylglucosaminyltransferase A/B
MPTPVQLPDISHFLPHLPDRPRALQPAVQLSRSRRGVRLTIGIPTVRRRSATYLFHTLHSFLDRLLPSERDEVLFVVFIGDVNDTHHVAHQVALIRSEFADHLDSGLLEVIVPSADYYPDLDAVPLTLGDPRGRVKWRAKQNLDYAYLMMYCQSRGRFYMQLEDDIVTVPNYYRRLSEFVAEQTDDEWLMVESSMLGFIGKLFRSSDLPLIVNFVVMLHRYKPVDWILEHVFYVMYCHPHKPPRACDEEKSRRIRRLLPPIFQHKGIRSSLEGKVQNWKEMDFTE